MNMQENKTNCHSKLDLESSTQVVYQQQRQASKILNQVQDDFLVKHHGFTLIELLVVVLIIGVLTAIAVPQYQKAVLKSRFSSLMPIAKSIANGNEIYYLEHGTYANAPTALDIAGQNSYPDGTTLTLGDEDDTTHNYVLAYNTGAKNRYIIYQNHSENYAGNTYCEAMNGDDQAKWLCEEALHGQTINKGISDSNYTAYLLSGTSTGYPPGYSLLAERVNCDKATAAGFSCTLGEDGKSKRTCYGNVNGLAGSYYNYCFEDQYDEKGNLLSRTSYLGSEERNRAQYDKNGRKIVEWRCKTYSNGECSEYYFVNLFDYDGNKLLRKKGCPSGNFNTATKSCEGNYGTITEYLYGENDNLIGHASCNTSESYHLGDSCSGYSVSSVYIYKYDEDDKITQYKNCTQLDGKTCTQTNDGGIKIVAWDENNNPIASKQCSGVSSCDGTFASTGYSIP